MDPLITGTIGSTPVENPRLAKLAALLRGAKEKLNSASTAVLPEEFQRSPFGQVGDLLLGDAPDEVKEWGYGNSPIRINPDAGRTASFVPEVVPGRQKGLADALSMVPMGGGGGASQAGTLPFKLRHLAQSPSKSSRVTDWVEHGIHPYIEAAPNTPKIVAAALKKSDKLRNPEELFRIAHDPEEIAAIKALSPGDIYSSPRILSTTRNKDNLFDVEENIDNWSENEGRQFLHIKAPAGTRVGGDLGPAVPDLYNGGVTNPYDEFLIRPGADFLMEGKGPEGEVILRALTDSEANLKKRIAKLRQK